MRGSACSGTIRNDSVPCSTCCGLLPTVDASRRQRPACRRPGGHTAQLGRIAPGSGMSSVARRGSSFAGHSIASARTRKPEQRPAKQPSATPRSSWACARQTRASSSAHPVSTRRSDSEGEPTWHLARCSPGLAGKTLQSSASTSKAMRPHCRPTTVPDRSADAIVPSTDISASVQRGDPRSCGLARACVWWNPAASPRRRPTSETAVPERSGKRRRRPS